MNALLTKIKRGQNKKKIWMRTVQARRDPSWEAGPSPKYASPDSRGKERGDISLQEPGWNAHLTDELIPKWGPFMADGFLEMTAPKFAMLSTVNLKCILLWQKILQLFLGGMPSSAAEFSQTVNLQMEEKGPKSTCAKALTNGNLFSYMSYFIHSEQESRQFLPCNFLKSPLMLSRLTDFNSTLVLG